MYVIAWLNLVSFPKKKQFPYRAKLLTFILFSTDYFEWQFLQKFMKNTKENNDVDKLEKMCGLNPDIFQK